MGIETGADKGYRVTENEQVIFKGCFELIEGVHFKYPNGEFVHLAEILEEVSQRDINLGKYLICDDFSEFDKGNADLIQQLNAFTFEDALAEGNKAMTCIQNHYEQVRKQFLYIYDPRDVLEYLLSLWEKGYYVNWSN